MARLLVGACMVLVFAVAPLAVQGQTPKTGGTMTIAVFSDAIKLDPGRTNDRPSTNVMDQLYDKLVQYDDRFAIVPSAATFWTASPNGLVWTFRLRRDVRFSNGAPLTSKDVAFSFTRILDQPDAVSQKRYKISMIDKIETPDAYTIRFTLKYPYAPFLGAVRQHVVPEGVVEQMGEAAFAGHPFGSGPFKVDTWKRDDSIVLARNDNYWMKRPNLDRLVFKVIPDPSSAALAVINGDVDVVQNIAWQMADRARQAGINIVSVEGQNYGYVGFREYGPPYTNVKFRQMVAYSTDWDKAVVAALGSGAAIRAYGPVSPGVWPRDVDYLKQHAYRQDTAKAKALLAELTGSGALPAGTAVEIHVAQNDVWRRVGEVMATSLKELGVNVDLKVDQWASFLSDVVSGKNGQIYVLDGTPAMPDPDAVYYFLFGADSTEGGSILGMKNVPDKARDDLIAQARVAQTVKQRQDMYTRLGRHLIVDDVYQVPLYHRNQLWAVARRVHDLTVVPTGDYKFVTSQHNLWVDTP